MVALTAAKIMRLKSFQICVPSSNSPSYTTLVPAGPVTDDLSRVPQDLSQRFSSSTSAIMAVPGISPTLFVTAPLNTDQLPADSCASMVLSVSVMRGYGTPSLLLFGYQHEKVQIFTWYSRFPTGREPFHGVPSPYPEEVYFAASVVTTDQGT